LQNKRENDSGLESSDPRSAMGTHKPSPPFHWIRRFRIPASRATILQGDAAIAGQGGLFHLTVPRSGRFSGKLMTARHNSRRTWEQSVYHSVEFSSLVEQAPRPTARLRRMFSTPAKSTTPELFDAFGLRPKSLALIRFCESAPNRTTPATPFRTSIEWARSLCNRSPPRGPIFKRKYGMHKTVRQISGNTPTTLVRPSNDA